MDGTDADVWASDDEGDLTSNKQDIMSLKDWGKVEINIEKDGYRQGLESGQETALQNGFNSAFTQAFEMAMAAGRLQGEICAKLQFCQEIKDNEKVVGSHTSTETTVKGERLCLNDTNDKVSSLISSIPNQLCKNIFEEKQCCGTTYVNLCGAESGHVEEVEKNNVCCNSLSVSSRKSIEFWDELENLKSNLMSN